MWAFFQKVFDYLMKDLSDRMDVILQNQYNLKELIMGLKDDLKNFALQVDSITNDLAGEVEQVVVRITKLQDQLAQGSLTAADLSEALAPSIGRLGVVSANLRKVAEGGDLTVPPVIVEPPPAVEPPRVVEPPAETLF